MKWNEMKCWECEGGRLTELHQVVSSIPNMPTHIKSLVNAVTVYSQCKTPWAGKPAKSTVTASHTYTSVAFINFRHLRTETPANKCSSNPLVSQQEWQKWIMCSEYPFYQVEICLNSENLWVFGDVFNYFFLLHLHFLHITFEKPLENRPLRCLHKALAWKHMWIHWSMSRFFFILSFKIFTLHSSHLQH